MGFMDRLKDTGKKAAGMAFILSAPMYGMVSAGEHKMCKISLNKTHDRLIFLKGAAVEKECVVKDEIRTFSVISDDCENQYHSIRLSYQDGKTSDVLVAVEKDRGSELPTAAERVAAQYAKAGELITLLAKDANEISDDTRSWANKIMRFANLPEL